MKGIQICSNEGPHPSQRGDNRELIKVNWQLLKIFFSRTTGPILTKLSTKYPWVKGIHVCSKEGPHPSPRGDNNKIAKIHWWNSKIFFSRTTKPISTKLGTKHSWVKGIQVWSNEGPRPFPRGDNCEIVKIHWQYLKIFFSRTTEPFSTKLGTKHPWMNGFQICSNEGPCSFSRGDNYKMVKIHWRNLEIFFSRTTEPISTKLGTNHPLMKVIQIYSNEGPRPFPRGDYYEIVKIHWQNSKIFFSRTTEPFSTKLGTKHPWVKGIQACKLFTFYNQSSPELLSINTSIQINFILKVKRI